MLASSVIARLLARVVCPLPPGRGAAAVTAALFAVAAFACLAFAQSSFGWGLPIGGAALAVALALVARTSSPLGTMRVARGLSGLSLAALHLFWLYEAVALALVLGWTIEAWGVAAVATLALASVATLRASWAGPRLPVALPLGILSVACLSGWPREEAVIRCDDYLAATGTAGVGMLVPTRPDLAQCRPGATFPIGRYPRRVWEDPADGRMVFTTQAGRLSVPGPSWIGGSVCEARPGDGRAPACFGVGKSHALRDAPGLGRLFVTFMNRDRPKSGALVAFPRSGALEPVATLELARTPVELFYDPDDDRLGLFFDEMDAWLPVRASTLQPDGTGDGSWNGDECRYDPRRHEGVLCGSATPGDWGRYLGYVAKGFSPRTGEVRPLGGGLLAMAELSWGCDADFERRRAYVGVANTGLIETLDLDSGDVLARHFAGLGVRAVLLDAPRGLLYVADFLRGRVTAVDAETGAEAGSWFVGHYVHDLVLSRDRRVLLATSNLGILGISVSGLDGRGTFR